MSTAATHDSRPFSVLLVCSGNICRSPLAEQLLRARADEFARTFGVEDARAWVSFSGAGTWGKDGDQMPDQAAAQSVRFGGDPSGHRARHLLPEMVEQSDLVLGMAREHRSEMVRMFPRASRYAFTLIEFARLLDDLANDGSLRIPAADVYNPAQVLRDLVAAVGTRRGIAPSAATPEAEDVVDPYRRSQNTYDLSGASVNDAVTSIFDSLATLADSEIVAV